jgi:curved DNA-binding protein CbpA
MGRIHSHYENLKVARDAPPEVIRAAYKTLSQKYHPDRHPGDPEAARIMTIINAAYDVLSDPIKRQAHDEWIASVEAARPAYSPKPPPYAATPQPAPHNASRKAGGAIAHVFRNWFWYGLAVLMAFMLFSENERKSASKPSVAESPGVRPSLEPKVVPSRPAYERPLVAPNGALWPGAAAYVQGYPRLRTNGHSSITIDNTRNDSDVFVKLVAIDGSTALPVRSFYIPARSSFRLNKVRAGDYDIRYRELDTGRLYRSDAFQLEEEKTADGVQFTNITMTLYKVRDGNMRTHGLTEEEF